MKKQKFSISYLFILAIAFGILLRVLNLGSREFWYDEVLSLLLSAGQKSLYETPADIPVVLANYTALLKPPMASNVRELMTTLVQLLRGLVGGEPHPPLFFLSQHFWLHLWGNSEIAMRSLNAILSGITIFCSYKLGHFLLGNRGGLLLAALLATNPFYLFHSLNVRMYAGVVFLVILSAWSLLEIIYKKSNFWRILLIISVAAGCLTFYLFIYWVITLVIVAIYLNRQRWWDWGICLSCGILLALPWGLWGIPQQLRNADLARFNSSAGLISTTLRHLQDIFQTLGTLLLLGDWVTSLSAIYITLAGIGVSLIFIVLIIQLKQNPKKSLDLPINHHPKNLLTITLLFSLFPLFLASVIDILTGKFTVGFGWGRSLILILPGCLLFLAFALETTGFFKKWHQITATGLILVYLGMSISDYTLRQRTPFHTLAAAVATQPATPTLIAMNSQAWGHVLRLAYYLPSTSPVQLLAQPSAKLAPALEKVFQLTPDPYARVIWLESADPVWSVPMTTPQREQMQKILEGRFEKSQQISLSGTMTLDEFILNIYAQ
jgi:uncharacterized membrane protein